MVQPGNDWGLKLAISAGLRQMVTTGKHGEADWILAMQSIDNMLKVNLSKA